MTEKVQAAVEAAIEANRKLNEAVSVERIADWNFNQDGGSFEYWKKTSNALQAARREAERANQNVIFEIEEAAETN